MQLFQEVRNPARRKYSEGCTIEFMVIVMRLAIWHRDRIWMAQHGAVVQGLHHIQWLHAVHITHWGRMDIRFGHFALS